MEHIEKEQEKERTEKEAEQGVFKVGDRVQSKNSGHRGVVVAVHKDGDPQIKFDGDPETGKVHDMYAKDFTHEAVTEFTFKDMGDDAVRLKNEGSRVDLY